MNAYELFAAMEGIGDDILERSEIKRKSPRRFIHPSLIAACCALVLSVLYAQLRYGILHPVPQMDPTQETSESLRQVVDTPYYNDAQYGYPEFDETSYHALYEVTHEEINAILPQPCPQWMEFAGEAMIMADGSVRTVMLGSLTSVENTEITIVLGQCDPGVKIKGEAMTYRCGQADFLMSQTEDNDSEPYWILTASAVIRSTPVYLEMYTSAENLDPAKAMFEEALQWLGNGTEDSLNLQKLILQSDPVIWTLPYSREQFEQESGYGQLLPEEDPQVYSDMEIVWEMHGSGVSEGINAACYQGEKLVLEWTVCFDLLMPGLYDERLSDRSMYMEAQELTLEAVEQFAKENTTFLEQSIYHAVHYEKFTIYVCARDVSAQWLYDQLVRIRDMQKDYSVYLPTAQYSETSWMTSETVFHGGLLNEMCVRVVEDESWLLTWTVMDDELLSGTDTLIQAQRLTQKAVAGHISGQGIGTLLVSYDDVIVMIESNGADVQWIYEQLIAVRERVEQVERDYSLYLPPEESELYSKTQTNVELLYGSYKNQTLRCFRGEQEVLYWSVGDSRLAEGIGSLIEAGELTVDMLEDSASPDGKICVDVLFDGVWISIDAYDIPAQWLYEQLIAVRERVWLNALNRYQEILRQPDLDELCLKIYYMSPDILTYLPMETENLKVHHQTKVISVDTQALLEYTELLERLDTPTLKPTEDQSYVNARMCYVFETGDGEAVFEVVINGPKQQIFVNGIQVEHDLVVFEVIEPFITEDLREVWQWDPKNWVK